MKVCKQCNKRKPLKEFVKNKNYKGGYATDCKVCKAIWAREWRRNNPVLVQESQKRFDDKRKADPSWQQKSRDRYLKSKYSISEEMYNIMFEKQFGCCAICNLHQTKLNHKLYVDHNHTTGEVRKLLCSHCNFLLGNCKEDHSILMRASQYLQETSE